MRATPSTMLKTLSTSPPKSACPGVSTILILTPRNNKLVHLDRMVMPRSFSRSLESITRVESDCEEESVPDCFSRQSTSVVLPWSTCAMIAMLRILSTPCRMLYSLLFGENGRRLRFDPNLSI